MNKTKMNGLIGWGLVAGAVGVWDTMNQQTMTESFQDALEDPVKKYLALGGMAITCAHLLDVIPHQIDPFHVLTSNIGKLATEGLPWKAKDH